MRSVKNISSYMTAINRLFCDACDIFRYVQRENPDTGETELYPELVAEKVKCRLSRKGRSSMPIRRSDSHFHVTYDARLFLDKNTDILAGDLVLVDLPGTVRRFRASEPDVFAAHQEVDLMREEAV